MQYLTQYLREIKKIIQANQLNKFFMNVLKENFFFHFFYNGLASHDTIVRALEAPGLI